MFSFILKAPQTKKFKGLCSANQSYALKHPLSHVEYSVLFVGRSSDFEFIGNSPCLPGKPVAIYGTPHSYSGGTVQDSHLLPI